MPAVLHLVERALALNRQIFTAKAQSTQRKADKMGLSSM